jgi:Fe-S cluster biogenesis protein NfuA
MIQTESTPNPDSLKFLSEKTLSTIGTEEFKKERENEIKIPFVKELLNFKGVELILLSEKFLSVKKTKEVSWNELKPMVISHLNDYFEKNNEPILKEGKKPAENAKNNDETVNKIIEVLDTKIRPAVARDGGDIKFKSFENGVVKVQLQGSCSGCPSSLMTLKQGVQNLLKHYVKEVDSVEAVQ